MKITITYLSASILFAGTSWAVDSKVLELGKQTFASCVACHGPDGKGVKAGELSMAPMLHESEFVKAESPEALGAVVLKGILKEDNKYVQAMLPLEAALQDEQIAAVVTYVRAEFGGKNDSIKPGVVKKWRQKYKEQSKPWKRTELGTIIKRVAAGPLLANVKYSVYKGSWNKLPDFSTMEPVLRGAVKNNKLSLDVAKGLKDNFGIVFEGDLKVRFTDTYEFSLLSDDGSALIIDGENVVMNDGIHGVVTKTAKEKLEAGEHTFKVLYFEKGGGEELALMAKAESIGEIQLSKRSVKKRGGGKSYDPIVLKPENGEAIVHRAFLPGAKPRSIGVGYPGGFNLAWDADVLNLAYMWRGEFMDAAPHWNGRGSGSKPLGEAQIKTAHGLPIQVLESLDEPWVPFSEATIKYERDKADPQKNLTYNVKHPDYQFRGYRLDKKRFPTFLYTYRDLEVSDTFRPAQVEGRDALVRKISMVGKAKESTYFRISDLSPGVPSADRDWIDIGKMVIRIRGGDPVFRNSEGKKEVLVLIEGDTEMEVTYRWKTPREEPPSAE